MRLVFADTLYWGAALHPQDQYRAQVIRAREALGEIHRKSYGATAAVSNVSFDCQFR